jgi:hypothetical protein
LLRELRGRGYSILRDHLHPYRATCPSSATMRYETAPGEQALLDFSVFRYELAGGVPHRIPDDHLTPAAVSVLNGQNRAEN